MMFTILFLVMIIIFLGIAIYKGSDHLYLRPGLHKNNLDKIEHIQDETIENLELLNKKLDIALGEYETSNNTSS